MSSLLDWLCPVIIPSGSYRSLPYVTWEYKPQLARLHRGVAVYIQLLTICTFMIIPVWILNAMQNDFFVAPKEGICLQMDGKTPMEYPGDEEKLCPMLSDDAVDDGWRLSPIQQHLHRYGVCYHLFIYLHVILGHMLVMCALLLLLVFLVTQCLSVENLTLRKMGACIHYLFCWLWVFNITVAITMAFTRLATLGTDPSKWNWIFSMAFLFLFYFVVDIILLSLDTLFYNEDSALTVFEVYLHNLTSYTSQGLFFLLIPTVVCVNLQKRLQDLLGFSNYDVIIVSIVTVYLIEPFMGKILTVYTGRQRYYKCISSCTVYFVTMLTYSINLTYKYDQPKTVPVLIFLAIIYLMLTAWMTCKVYNHRKQSKDPDWKFSFVELLSERILTYRYQRISDGL